MSHTNESELLEARCLKSVESLDDLAGAMRARVRNAAEWSHEHLTDLTATLGQIDQLVMKLLITARENR